MPTHDDFDDPHDGFLTALWTAGTAKVRAGSRKMTVAAGIGLLVILAAVLWASTRHHGGPKTADAIPVVQAPSVPWRVKPADPGGMEIPYRDSTVFNALQPTPGKAGNPPDVPAGDRVENLLAPAEQPVPKSKLFPPAATAPAPTDEATTNTVETPDADDFMPDDAAVNKAPAAPTTATAASGYYVQLGAVTSAAAAQASWKRAQTAYPELSDLSLHVEPVAKGSATLYRVQAGPVDQAQAHALCAAITVKKPGGCLVVKH